MPGELDVIADPSTDAARAAEAVRALGVPPQEPPSFWTAIAEDPRYPPSRRRTAVLQLVLRHVRPGTAVAELGAWLRTILREGDVGLLEDVAGALPVSAEGERTLVRIAVLPDEPGGPCFVFLAVEGIVDRDAFLAALAGRPGAANARIVERATHPEDGVDAG